MGLKGINPLEQHVEKIVAGIFGVALLGAVAYQFMGVPTVKVGSKDNVSLDSAYDVVAEEAKKTKRKMESTEWTQPEGDSANADSITEFVKRFRGPVAPSPTIATSLDSGSGLGELARMTSDSAPLTAPLAAIAIPATARPMAAAFVSTVDPIEAAESPEVAAVLPPVEPMDKAAVTVEARFDGKLLHAALSADPDGSGPGRPMPSHWWNPNTHILVVELQRQELLAGGTWGKETAVAAMPGRFSLAKEVAKGIPGAAVLNDMLKLAGENSNLVRRPDYYLSRHGESWRAPSEIAAELTKSGGVENAALDEVGRKKRELEQKQKELARIEDDLEALGQGGQRPPRDRDGGGGGGGGGGKSPGGGGGGNQPPDRPRADPNEQKRKTLESRRERVLKEIENIAADLRERGVEVATPGMDPANMPNPGRMAPKGEIEASLLDNTAVQLWAHDVTVERGKTYRYRMVLVLNNPFFGHASVLVHEQQDWAKSPVTRNAPSEWSESVDVPAETYYFITSASAADPLSPTARASAELYMFTWGYWRKGSTQLEPGDRVEAEVKVPDMLKVLPVAAAPGNAPDPAAPAPNRPDGGRGRDIMPVVQPPRDARQPVNPNDPADPGANPTKIPMLPVERTVDAYLLNVGSVAAQGNNGRGGGEFQAYMRNALGEVVVRIPDGDRNSTIYQLVSRSAAAGELDLKPKEPAKQRDDPTKRPRPEEIAPPGKSPGGGGGS